MKNQSTIKIRPGLYADIPAILDIYNDAILSTTASYDLEPQTLTERIHWYEKHQEEGYPVMVAEYRGKVAGWASLSAFSAKAGYRFSVEDSIYISEGHRGFGLGRKLLDSLLEAAKKKRYHAVIALIDAENEISIRLHASRGFEEVGRLKEAGCKFDRWLDVVYMEKIMAHDDNDHDAPRSDAELKEQECI
jgi:phosphinothricin acetyltransferase